MRLSNSFGFALFLLLLREKHGVFLLICLFLLITKVFIKFKRILFGKHIRLCSFKWNLVMAKQIFILISSKRNQWRHQKKIFVGYRGGKMRLWGGKNPKNCQKWLILTIFFLLTGGGASGEEPPRGGQMPPLDAATETNCYIRTVKIQMHYSQIIPIY